MRDRKGCIICHSRTQELDPTGRCGSCAAVLRAKRLNLTYGNLIAVEANPVPEKTKGNADLCEFCGKPFTKKHPSRRYCCDECRNRACYRKRVAARG